ncbi:hypothetical protein H9L41_05555 [Chitinimonas koreensis]|nr:hypothetical protein [Chitinimonas koreensis]QNM97749.1 hypothetical protein H9L41_05555 [Chitinimonas koreensis]
MEAFNVRALPVAQPIASLTQMSPPPLALAMVALLPIEKVCQLMAARWLACCTFSVSTVLLMLALPAVTWPQRAVRWRRMQPGRRLGRPSCRARACIH